MRQIPQSFAEHLEGEATTYCRCWKVIRRDGHVLGFTEHDSEITVDGVVYQPTTGLDSSGAQTSLGLNPDSVEVVGALVSDKVSQKDILADKYDSARVEVLVVNWSDSQQYFLEHVYFIGEIRQEDGMFKAELRTLASQLDQTKGAHYIRQCQADLGDSKCKFDLNSSLYQDTATVTDISGAKEIVASGLSQYESQWFTHGHLEWVSGENQGVSIEISDHLNIGTNATLQLWREMSLPLQIGDQFKITVGCNKQFETCKSKFSNAINFRGFPHLPGSEFALKYVNKTDDLDGGIIVP